MIPLKRFHREPIYEVRRYRISLEYWRKRTTAEILYSLRPGHGESLRVRENGIVMQGNTRIKILQERGYNVDDLPRTPC